ncbi:unnamed protein product [Ixodes pacificus]
MNAFSTIVNIKIFFFSRLINAFLIYGSASLQLRPSQPATEPNLFAAKQQMPSHTKHDSVNASRVLYARWTGEKSMGAASRKVARRRRHFKVGARRRLQLALQTRSANHVTTIERLKTLCDRGSKKSNTGASRATHSLLVP